MLHLIWYIIVGFLAGWAAKALLHVHLPIVWTIVLGIVGSIVGGAVTHLFSPPSAGGPDAQIGSPSRRASASPVAA